MPKKATSKIPSQRQRKVSEMIKQALSAIFLERPFYGSPLEGVSITVTSVDVSPDLKNARVYVTALGGNVPDYFIETLKEYMPMLRKLVTKRVQLRFSPRLQFEIDDSFEVAQQVHSILSSLPKTEQPAHAE